MVLVVSVYKYISFWLLFSVFFASGFYGGESFCSFNKVFEVF